MPSHDLLFYFQQAMQLEKHWHVNGAHYGLTSEAWLQASPAHSLRCALFLVLCLLVSYKLSSVVWGPRFVVLLSSRLLTCSCCCCCCCCCCRRLAASNGASCVYHACACVRRTWTSMRLSCYRSWAISTARARSLDGSRVGGASSWPARSASSGTVAMSGLCHTTVSVFPSE